MSFFIERLKIYLIVSKTDGEICLITSEEISSCPELFFVFKVLRASFNSSSVMGHLQGHLQPTVLGIKFHSIF